MSLPANFQFSQGSLQDYADCPRRFQLKYIQQLSWPAVHAEPALDNEVYLQLGAKFHRIVQQYLLGLPEEKLALQAARDIHLSNWWDNFSEDVGRMVNRKTRNYETEITLTAPIGEFRLVGKYDLLIKSDQEFIIYDWKTSRKHPKREWLASNLQTRVYPYLLAQAGDHLNNGNPILPDQIQMIYWFANFPTAPLRFPYNQAQFAEDQTYLTNLIEEIKSIGFEMASMTENETRCRYCIYRSLCNRGIEAGQMDEFEGEGGKDLFEFDLDFEQIAEIEF